MSKAAEFDPDIRLQRHPRFTVRGTPSGLEVVSIPQGQSVVSAHATTVMSAFAQPRSVREVSAQLAAGLQHRERWMAAMDCIQDCVSHGILVSEGQPLTPSIPRGIAGEAQQLHMLNDATRTRAFLDAIKATVGPDDIVLDIGTGTGVLAMAAARAGAAHVFAVEASATAELARAGVAANGLTDRVTVLQGHSTDITLPRPATVVIGEIIGDDPFDEFILESFADAADRLSTADARFIPASLAPMLVPLALSDELLSNFTYTSAATQRWSALYDLDFTWLLDERHRASATTLERHPQMLKRFQCGPTITLPAALPGEATLTYEATAHWPGYVGANAIALAFTCQLATDIWVTTNPAEAGSDCHWGLPVWIPQGVDLARPGQVTVSTSSDARTNLAFHSQTIATAASN